MNRGRRLRSGPPSRDAPSNSRNHRRNYDDDDDSQDPTYDPAIDNVYQPGEELAADEDEEEDDDDDGIIAGDDDVDENGENEEAPRNSYEHFYSFNSPERDVEREWERRFRTNAARRRRNEEEAMRRRAEEEAMRRRAEEEAMRRRAEEEFEEVFRGDELPPEEVGPRVVHVDDDIIIYEGSEGSSSDEPAIRHSSPRQSSQNRPSGSGLQRPHEDNSSDSDVELRVTSRPKRARVESQDEDEEEKKEPPPPAPPEDDDDDDVGCTICYEEFTSSGEHRLVSLKCGHFFGKSCIERWIRAEGRGAVCPTCKGKAQVKDIRVHFMRSVKMTDNSELVQLRVTNTEFRRRIDCLEMDKEKLRRELEIVQNLVDQKGANAKKEQPAKTIIRCGKMGLFPCSKGDLSINNSTTLSKAFDFNGAYFAVGVHCPKNGGMFSPYGIKKTWFEGHHLVKGTVIPNHANRSRVVVFSPFENDICLSAGEDMIAAIHNMGASGNRRVWKLDKPIWSGCWLSKSRFVVGLTNGRVYEFDRESDGMEPVRDITQGIGKMPIIFIANDIASSVLLVASFKKLIAFHGDRVFPFLSNDTDGYDSIRSVAWDARSLHFCVTFGAAPGKTISHRLYRLDVSDLPNVSFVEVNTWVTTNVKSTTLWNNCLFSTDDGIFSLVFSEDSRQLEVHDWTKGRNDVTIKFSTSENVCDMKIIGSLQGEKKIAVLTERHIYAVTFICRDD